jgi:hypothetical protein
LFIHKSIKIAVKKKDGIEGNKTLKTALLETCLYPESYLAIKNGELITMDGVLYERDQKNALRQ